jgi:alcohol dehydrogenase
VTAVAVISNTKEDRKQGVVGKNCIPTLAIVDPSLTLGLSPQITAATGMDTFSHAAEAFTSARNNPMSDLLALEAMSLVAVYLPVAVKDGSDAEARAKMSFASTIAGMSFNDAAPHLGHAIGHTMGAKFHVPHGMACGLAMPAVIEYISDVMPDKVRSIGKAIGLVLKETLSNDETGIIVADAVRRLNRDIGLPTLDQLDIEESGLNSIAADTPADVCAFNVPKKITPEDVLKLLQKEYALSGE